MATFTGRAEAQCKEYSHNDSRGHRLEWETVLEALSWEGIFAPELLCQGLRAIGLPTLFVGLRCACGGGEGRERGRGATQRSRSSPWALGAGRRALCRLMAVRGWGVRQNLDKSFLSPI